MTHEYGGLSLSLQNHFDQIRRSLCNPYDNGVRMPGYLRREHTCIDHPQSLDAMHAEEGINDAGGWGKTYAGCRYLQ